MPRRPRKPAPEASPPSSLSLTLLAQYRQVHLMDAQASGDLSHAWTEQAVSDRVAVADGIVGLGCERDQDVRVTLEVLTAAPAADAERFDHVSEASLSVPSGELAVLGCTDYLPDAARLRVPLGDLRVRASHTNLAKGRETIRVQLWPAPPAPPAVLARWAPPAKAAKPNKATKPGAAAKPVRNVKQARLLALSGQPDTALAALLAFAAEGDASASASAAELLAFMGRWEDVVPHAMALLAKPEAVYAGNVFDDMCALLRRAARELSDPELIPRAAAVAPPARQEQVKVVLLQDSPNLSATVAGPDTERFVDAVAKAETDKRFTGKPLQLARHAFALAVSFRVQDQIIARFDPSNPELHFDAAVSAACALVRQGDPAAAWAALESKLHAWWPVDKSQVAPVVLLVHPLLAPLMTAERCAHVLATARAGAT